MQMNFYCVSIGRPLASPIQILHLYNDWYYTVMHLILAYHTGIQCTSYCCTIQIMHLILASTIHIMHLILASTDTDMHLIPASSTIQIMHLILASTIQIMHLIPASTIQIMHLILASTDTDHAPHTS